MGSLMSLKEVNEKELRIFCMFVSEERVKKETKSC